jgi:hypothetical protein
MRKFRPAPTLPAVKDGIEKKGADMRNTILAAAAVTLTALAGAALADPATQEPAIQGHAIEYGESPSGANINTTQPSGGSASDELSAPTHGLAGSVTGAANMNGPTRDGQPLDPDLQTGDSHHDDTVVIINDGR